MLATSLLKVWWETKTKTTYRLLSALWIMRAFFSSSSSGLSLATTIPRSWSSRPSGVIMKFNNVTCRVERKVYEIWFLKCHTKKECIMPNFRDLLTWIIWKYKSNHCNLFQGDFKTQKLVDPGHRNPRERRSQKKKSRTAEKGRRIIINKNPEKKIWGPQNADFGP